MTTETPPHPFPNLFARSKEGGGIYVGNAVWRDVDAGHANAMQSLVALCAQAGIRARFGPIINDALIIRARNRAASDFLATDADVLVTIDSDIEFDPFQLLRMAEETFTYSLVGGSYVKRNGHFPEMAIRLFRPASGEAEIRWAEGEPLVKVEYLATGFMAVHRRVLEKMRDEWEGGLQMQHQSTLKFYTFYDPISIVKGQGEIFRLSEDWAFCQRAMDLGFDCWVDPRVRLRHWGLYDFTMEDIVRVARPEPGIIVWRFEHGMESFGYAPQPWVVKTKDGFLMHLLRGDKMISKSIADSGEWEPEVADAVRQHVKFGTKFLDIGANLGYFSLLAASLGGNVYAIEPNPETRNLMGESAVDNKFTLTMSPYAASNVTGKFTLNTEGLGNQGEAFLTLLNEKTGPTVEVRPLDDILPFDWQPDVIKMDIEGEEWNAIQGSPEIFEKARVVIFEYSPEQLKRGSQMEVPEDLFKWFEERGFKCELLSQHASYEDWIAVRV